jgi:hypothetical protein
LIWLLMMAILIIEVVVGVKAVSRRPDSMMQTDARPARPWKDALARSSMRQKLRDPIPPVMGFSIVSAQAAGSAIPDEDHVLGVELGGESRAYAINMMGKPDHELLNDTLAGWPIAVTFCSKCQSPVVFSRQVEGDTLTLYIDGEVLAENMIIRDVESGTDWIQLTGEATQGPLKGHRLEQIPVVWTDWKTWREHHPETTLPELPNTVQDYRHHPLYSAFPGDRSFFAGLQWGLASGMKARSWPYAQLMRRPLVNDVFAGQPLLVVFDTRTSTTNAYDRRTGDRELTFRWQTNNLADDQTGSVWDPVTGQAIKGPLTGRRLTPIAGIVSLVWAWSQFHPESETWAAKEGQAR